MKTILFAAFISALSFGGELPPAYRSNDPKSCQYWIERFDEIAYWERCREEDVPKMEQTDGFHAAVDYDIVLRERIRAVMKGIERDAK